jgi:hypothetical protein
MRVSASNPEYSVIASLPARSRFGKGRRERSYPNFSIENEMLRSFLSRNDVSLLFEDFKRMLINPKSQI